MISLSTDAQKPNPHLTTFNDHQLIVIEFEDRPWFIAKQVGAKLGYADEGKSLKPPPALRERRAARSDEA